MNRKKINLTSIKIENCCSFKDTVKDNNKTSHRLKVFANHLIKVLYAEYIKNFDNSIRLCMTQFKNNLFVAQMIKESACNAGDPGSIPGSGRSLEKGMATHSNILAWKIPWTEEPGGYSPGDHRVRHDRATLSQFKNKQPCKTSGISG